MAVGIADIPAWLASRLGSSDKLWVDGSIAPFLTKDLLKGIYECFLDLQSPIKIKLLLSFLHIVRRSVENLKYELEAIIDLAAKDSDQWVSLTAEFLKTFPARGEFNLNIVENADMFEEMQNDIRRHLKILHERCPEISFPPHEAEFLNRKAFMATFGTLAPPVKHFTLKQKPKSATLRADALSRASDLTKPKNQAGAAMPVRFKDNTKALEAISAEKKRNYIAGPQARVMANREKTAAAAKARGGVKLLELGDIQHSLDQAGKRRKKLGPQGSGSDVKEADEHPEQPDVEMNAEHTDTPAASQSQSPERRSESPSKTPIRSPDFSGSSQSNPLSSPTRNATPVAIETPPVAQSSSQAPQIVQPAVAPDLKNIKLTKELQDTVMDVFKNANRVTRPEKMVIVNFIAGNRVNPCPHLGDVLTIRLSEHLMKMPTAEGVEEDMIVEDYFHMNYATGEWKRIKKQKPAPRDYVAPQS